MTERLVRLRILQDKFQRKVNDYMRAYQIDGKSSQLRTAERNEFMAQTVADAITCNEYNVALCEVEHRVSIIPTNDPEMCVEAVRRLQEQVSERKYLR